MKVNPINKFGGVMLGVLVLSFLLPAQVFAAPPVVTTLTATNLTATNALLRGTVNPGGASTLAWLEWGPGHAFKSSTTRTNVGNGSSPLNFSAPVSNLTAGIIYRCRAVASNSLGIVRGQPFAFGVPTVTLNGNNPFTNALNGVFVDPGATATGLPAALAVGDSFTVVLKANGELDVWGLNTDGQTNIPAAVTNITAIAAGFVHGLAARANGSVIGWGTNILGLLDIPANATNVVALAAGWFHNLALRSNGTIASWGSDALGQRTVPVEATNVVAIAAGYAHSLALRSDGTVVEWGIWGGNEELGDATPPPEATNIVAIAAGYAHSVAVRADGTVVAWGGDPTINLDVVAVPESATNVIAIAAGYSHNVGLRGDGTLVGWGSNSKGEITFPSGATNVIAIGGGFGFSQALRADGSVIGWGNPTPNVGQTANPTNLTVNLPVTGSGTVNTFAVGTYPLLYSATNIFGFTGTATRSVVVPGGAVSPPNIGTFTLLGNGTAQLVLDYAPGSVISVLTATNITVPASNWTVLGTATESPSGHFVFIDAGATNYGTRYYRTRTP
jgi:hypothetical protein